MATYGDRYVFAFETTGATKAGRDIQLVETRSQAAALALNTLAAAWDNYSASVSRASAVGGGQSVIPPTSLRNVQVINNTGSGVTSNSSFQDKTYNRVQNITNPATPAPAGGTTGGGAGTPFGMTGLSRYAMFWAEGFAISAVLMTIQKGISDWNMVQRELDSNMGSFQVSLQGTRREVEDYSDALMELSKATGLSFTELGPGLTTQMRVMGAPSDLALRAGQVQRVTGVDNLAAERDLLSLAKQFPDKSTVQILDAFSGAMRRSSLQADEFFGMLESAGPLSHQFNTSMETIFGLFAGLSTVTGESGSSIELFMRQMERIYNEQSTRSVVEKFIGPVSMMNSAGEEIRRPIDEILGELAQLGPQAWQEVEKTIPNMLGQQTRQLFRNMMTEWEKSITDAIQGASNATGEWNKDVEIMSATWAANVDQMGAAWHRFLLAVGDSSAIKNTMREITNALDEASLKMQYWDKHREYREATGQSDWEGTRIGNDPGTANWRLTGNLERIYTERTGESPNERIKVFGKSPDDSFLGGITMPGEYTEEFVKWAIRFLEANTPDLTDPRTLGMAGGGYGRNGFAPYASQQTPQYSYVPAPSFYQQPGMYPFITDEQKFTLPKGMTMAQLDKMSGEVHANRVEAFRNQTVVDQYGNATQPYSDPNIPDTTIEKLLGNDVEMSIAGFDDLGNALGMAAMNASDAEIAMAIFSESIKEAGENAKTARLKVSRQDWMGEEVAGQSLGERALFAYESKRDRLIAQARKDDPTQAGLSDAEVAKNLGYQEQRTTLLSEEGFLLQAAAVDAAQFAAALAGLSGVMQQLSYFNPPEGMSDAEYAAQLNAGSKRNLELQRRTGTLDMSTEAPEIRQWVGPGGGVFPVEGNDESLAQSAAGITRTATATERANSLAAQQNAKLDQINESIKNSVKGFVSGILQATPVTKDQLSASRMGSYTDQWDEPVRRVRDVVARREGMNPNLGPWQDFARSAGIDTSSIDSTVVTGAEFERKFYNGLMPAELYDQYSKEGFINQARGRIGEMEGKKNLETQALGWLKEAGIEGDLASYYAKEFSGTISPAEVFIRGGKDNAALATDFEDIGTVSATGMMTGMATSIADEKPTDKVISAFAMESDEVKTSATNLGKAFGGYFVDGMGEAVKDAIIGKVTAKVLEAIDLGES